MISVNLTLIFQAINFFIAYLIIKHILLKPALELLHKDYDIEKKFINSIFWEQKKIANLNEIMSKQWQQCLNYFIKNRPEINFKNNEILQIQPIKIEKIDIEQLQFYKQQLIDTLKEKVIND